MIIVLVGNHMDIHISLLITLLHFLISQKVRPFFFLIFHDKQQNYGALALCHFWFLLVINIYIVIKYNVDLFKEYNTLGQHCRSPRYSNIQFFS